MMNARAFAVYQESQREATVDQATPLDLVILTYERAFIIVIALLKTLSMGEILKKQ